MTFNDVDIHHRTATALPDAAQSITVTPDIAPSDTAAEYSPATSSAAPFHAAPIQCRQSSAADTTLPDTAPPSGGVGWREVMRDDVHGGVTSCQMVLSCVRYCWSVLVGAYGARYRGMVPVSVLWCVVYGVVLDFPEWFLVVWNGSEWYDGKATLHNGVP